MKCDKEYFRQLLLYCFKSKKTAAEAHRFISETYSEFSLSVKTCEYWYRRFRCGDFDLKDKERSGQPKKFEDTELQALLDKNSAQTLQKLAEALNVSKSTVSNRLHVMGKIQKKGKWVPHALSELATQNRNRNTSDKVNNNDIGVTSTEADKEEEIKDGIKMEYIFKNHIVDTEMVEGLQLSVECAREKEEPSIESENKDDIKPRLETLFIKAEPYESELECSLSEKKNLDFQEVTNMTKTKSAKKTVDTKVIEGLELSVECASVKEELSIESENKDDVKPRLETIFIKTEPYESGLECSLSERKNLDSQEANISKTKLARRKKRSSQTNSDTLKFNESDDSQDNNCDEKYSPRTKKTKLSIPKKSTKRSVALRKRRSKDIQRSVGKKNTEFTSDDENPEATSTLREIKKEIKVKTEEALSEKKSSASETESIVIYNFAVAKNNSVDKNTPVNGKRKRYSNVVSNDFYRK